jgi:N-acetylglucosaminyl-diphospho-decaprenol L-rhamnosyltransferase
MAPVALAPITEAPFVPAPLPRKARPVRRRATTPRLSVVVVNYDQWDKTAQLVRQLRSAVPTRTGTAEAVIVDNHSRRHRITSRLRRLPGVSLRRWGRNRGFARAVNEGCRLSQGEWFLLLNPDVSLSEGFLDNVLALADLLTRDEPRAGIIGFQLRDRDGRRQLSSGPFPTLMGTLGGLFLPRRRRKYRRVHGRKRVRVPWVTGCCLLVRRDCFRQLSGFDRDFFVYYEDVDFCRRAQEHGWSVWFEPGLRVVHERPLHSRNVPAHLRVLVRHGLLTYAAKHWPLWQLRLLSAIVRGEAWLRRWAAWWRGAKNDAALFAELDAMAANMGQRRIAAARRQLRAIVQREEQRRAS